MVSTKTCKRQLATLWFAGSLALFLLLVLQSVFGKYGAKAEEHGLGSCQPSCRHSRS